MQKYDFKNVEIIIKKHGKIKIKLNAKCNNNFKVNNILYRTCDVDLSSN